ncbi:uncharacterized protein [Physcomitrium patens]|uniref:Activator of Hsp90 ATPase AHSA1-like N-terminal domain-containing protein n=1 Tax=Physcomitrium patens TaxID=3218 RepID=A0A2K1J6X2_PHYPA|nr:uncharacterized protein LOC112293723 [Physcomitrium patens]PNR37269.1 hypothetical protein PHYPA_020377 [Physcomitrium patens]|eukprot:XP_024399262.1 uncharacterized protein LOC112293723 [Physcomitrella patens]
MAKEKQEEEMGEMKEGGEERTSKTSGYRYWVRGTMQGAAPEPVPYKLTAEELAGNGKPACLGSTWNQAGTWEEKVLSSWAWNRVKELLPTVEPVEFEGGTARVVEVTTCSGDASLITVRQKKKVGYTLEIEMKYSANVKQGEEKKDFEGKMKVPEACYGELDDLELDVIVSASDIKDSVQRKRVKQTLMDMFLPKIRRKLEDFEAELKER